MFIAQYLKLMVRRISEIKNLPISQLTDEEIVQVTMHRLQARAIVMGILDQDNKSWMFYRYKGRQGKQFCATLKYLYRSYFFIAKRITNNE